jgi:hypothetical protein
MERPNSEPRISVENIEVGVVCYDPFRVASDGGVNELVVVLIEPDRIPAVRRVHANDVIGVNAQEIPEARPSHGTAALFENLLVFEEDVV